MRTYGKLWEHMEKTSINGGFDGHFRHFPYAMGILMGNSLH